MNTTARVTAPRKTLKESVPVSWTGFGRKSLAASGGPVRSANRIPFGLGEGIGRVSSLS